MKRLGLDVGSTTMKYVLLDEQDQILAQDYLRHASKIGEVFRKILGDLQDRFPGENMAVTVSGSAGMGLAEKLGLPFVQEVYAERLAVGKYYPDTDAVIELGGEDAKILFLTGGFEMRMNGTCAGGTGAFIDQMASLMQVTPGEMNDLAAGHETVLPIASRCGVFAKSDVQPLLNQGARREDVSAGIFRAVVNQTIAGLAQGREITGKILYLGGPLSFLTELRKSFDEVLKTTGICPENSLYYVALGACFAGVGKESDLGELVEAEKNAATGDYRKTRPLFRSKAEYEEFAARHKAASEGIAELTEPKKTMYLGIDAGSTTVKAVLCDENGNVFRPFYCPNHGDPVGLIREYLTKLYADYPGLTIAGSAVTGYGEALLKSAFSADHGIVETVAHYTAAKKFHPDVDFIIDIGGQDIKCFQVKNGLIDSLYLNEACSSGCGSFLQTFAQALGYTSEEFARLGLFADAPVDLGSRCTVFMNSSVKQAQKDGASVENIAAGLSISVVKNALYKVIRCADTKSLGKNIVVQGGTFLNDCVLRAFEQEIGANVIRPRFAGLMGAYGAALYAKDHTGKESTFITRQGLEEFEHTVHQLSCGGCQNHCSLTVNTFSGGRRYIAGNRCSRPLKQEHTAEHYDLYEYKRTLLQKYRHNYRDPNKKTVGIPMGLNFYELLPFWYTFFQTLDFNVVVSPDSSRALYASGQHTIPSDTACYPAKLMHGHIEWLLDQKVDAIFYPDMSYNVEEGLGVNHFNCPVVAYYPQVLKLNVPRLKEVPFICDFVSLANPVIFEKRITEILRNYFPKFSKTSIAVAAELAYDALVRYRKDVEEKGEEFREKAAEEGKPVIVLAGRPYHVDPEVNHGISKLICDLGAVVITEDSLSRSVEKFPTKVRNQWTYHARMYAAAKYIAEHPEEDLHLVQLVSFGCGVDAITTDEARSILESAGRDYTQIKIDEISNMGAVTIRLRSLFAMLEEKNK